MSRSAGLLICCILKDNKQVAQRLSPVNHKGNEKDEERIERSEVNT